MILLPLAIVCYNLYHAKEVAYLFVAQCQKKNFILENVLVLFVSVKKNVNYSSFMGLSLYIFHSEDLCIKFFTVQLFMELYCNCCFVCKSLFLICSLGKGQFERQFIKNVLSYHDLEIYSSGK